MPTAAWARARPSPVEPLPAVDLEASVWRQPAVRERSGVGGADDGIDHLERRVLACNERLAIGGHPPAVSAEVSNHHAPVR